MDKIISSTASSTKPVVFYVDDEPQNLVVFEAACPDSWQVYTFDNAVAALEKLESHKPWLIVSDQRMPVMNGVQFLELARKLSPDAIRIIATGFSDEDLVVQSVRKAQIFDYIKKPWDVDELVASLQRGLDLYTSIQEARRLQNELVARERQLKESNDSLTHAMKDLEIARHKEQVIQKELESWVPPFVLVSIHESKPLHNTEKDIIGIAIDIINSSRLHGVMTNGRTLRSQIIQVFSEAVLRHGGWRESHSGDSAYGHFGLLSGSESPAEAALSAAREFRVALRSLASTSGLPVECGIALHVLHQCPIHIHTVHLNTSRGVVTQKSFDTSSSDVDLLHRMEKFVHKLPGTNIIMSKDFVEQLSHKPTQITSLGPHQFSGQTKSVDLLLFPSDLATQEDIEKMRLSLTSSAQISTSTTVISVDFESSQQQEDQLQENKKAS